MRLHSRLYKRILYTVVAASVAYTAKSAEIPLDEQLSVRQNEGIEKFADDETSLRFKKFGLMSAYSLGLGAIGAILCVSAAEYLFTRHQRNRRRQSTANY